MGQYFTNQKLKSNIKKINCLVRRKKFEFYTDNGVFMNFFHKYGGASNADGIKNYLTSINYRFS